MRTLIFAVFIIFAGSHAAFAGTTFTWAGGSSGNWTTASNWSPSTAYPGQTGTTDIAVINTSNITVTLTSTLTIAQLQSPTLAVAGITISVSSGATLNVTSGLLTSQPPVTEAVFTFAGSGTTKIGGPISLGQQALITIAAGATLYLTGTAVLDASTNFGPGVMNAGTLNILSGAQLLFGNSAQLINSGTINSSGAAFNFTGLGSPYCIYQNTGTIVDHGSTMSFSGQNAAFQNSAAGSVATLHGAQINFTGTSNTQSITNAGTLTIDSTAVINDNTTSSFISNTGTFYAGTSNSSCTIVLSGPTTNLTNTGTFYLGSTSAITFGGLSASLSATAGTFTVQSDAYGSGAIGAITNSATVTGTLTIQRYLQGGAGYRSYRMLSSPVYTATISGVHVYRINYLKNSIYLTGTTTTGGFDNTVPANPTLYLYRENLTNPAITTFLNSNFIGIKAINNVPLFAYSVNDATYTSTYNIPAGSGFLCFFRGDRSTSFASKTTAPFPVPENTTLSTSGTINSGTISLRNWFNPGTTNLSYTAATPFGYRGFNLAGNPYPCTIDWETYQSTNTGAGIYGNNISSTIYELNPLTENFDAYQFGGASTNNATRYLVSGQAFFVVASGSSSSLTFYETAKAPAAQNTGPSLYLGIPDQQTVNSQHLKLQISMDAVNTDDTYIGFNRGASRLYNDTTDAVYEPGMGKVGLASRSADNVELAINRQPLPVGSETIGLTIRAKADGIYSLNMIELAGIPQLYDIWLMDAYKKDSIDMRHNPTYSFNVYKSDTNSFGAHRFSLVIRENPAYAYRLLNFTAVKINSDIRQVQISWNAENEQNYTSFTVERSTDGGKTYDVIGSRTGSGQGTYSITDTTPTANNIYRLKSEDIDNAITYSNLVPIAYSDLSGGLAQGSIIVYPNPVSKIIYLTIANPGLVNTNYDIVISNSSGVVVKQATSKSPTWQADATSMQPGTYVIKVLNATDHSEIGNAKFVKT